VTQQPREPGSDPIGDVQRWLVRSGARTVTRGLTGQLRAAFGSSQHVDVWESATTEPPEAPECAWCPICRARRRLRESGPGLASHVAAASDAVSVVMQDAMSAFETAMATAGRQARPRATSRSASQVWDMATDESGSTGVVAPGAAPAGPAAGGAQPPTSRATGPGPVTPGATGPGPVTPGAAEPDSDTGS
jgi:hypothetical protein